MAHASGMFPGSRVGVLVWKRSWASLVPLGDGGEWCGYAFGFPDRHPRRLVACGFPDAPGGTPWACGPRAGSCRGAWWFENWIVDASNAGFFVLLALSRFRQALLFLDESGFEIDRFVIIFYSVMICRLAFEAIIGFFGACAALKGVWWMPWQTVPMKDV